MTSRPQTRIAVITTVGITQYAFMRGQHEYIHRHGFDIHAIAAPSAALDRLAARDPVTVHGIPMVRGMSPLSDLIALVRLYLLLRKLQPEIVHLSTPKAALLGSIASWMAGVPVRILLYRGSVVDSANGITKVLLRWADRLAGRLCHRTFCVSHSLQQFAEREHIFPPGGSRVLGNGMSNGVDADRFDPARVTAATLPGEESGAESISPVIGFVGRLSRDKGIVELEQAWRGLREAYPDAHLLVVGNWEERDAVSRNVQQRLREDPRVVVTGFVERVEPYYKRMSLLVFPSCREGFPNAPMEAASMELPVVAFAAVGTLDAVQHDVTGKLVPARDVDALADAIRVYLEDPQLRRQHGKAGRARVLRDFQPQAIWGALLAEYNTLLNERGIASPTTPSKARKAA